MSLKCLSGVLKDMELSDNTVKEIMAYEGLSLNLPIGPSIHEGWWFRTIINYNSS